MTASPSPHFAHESSGPGGKLYWSERRDGHWHAEAPGGHFDVVPMARGYHLWWRGKAGAGYVDLGHHGSLGSAFAGARYYLDEGVPARTAAEEGSPDPAFSRYTQLVVDSIVESEGVTYEEARRRIAQHQEAVHAHYEDHTPPKDVVFNVRGLRRPAEESAKECCGDEKCAHRHPPSVPTTACEAGSKLEWSELYHSSKLTIYRAPTSHPHESYYIEKSRGKWKVELHMTEHAPIKVVVLGREGSLDRAKEVADEHHRARQAMRHLSGEAREASLSEAPSPMHIEIPADAYAQWVAYGDAMGPVDTTEKVYKLLSSYAHKQDQEVFLVVVTDLHFKLRSVTEVARGERSSVGVGIEEVMRATLMTPGVAHMCVAHQHPTGKCRPSKADRDLHKSIEQAAASYASLTYLDHVVIGVGEYHSIREGKTYKVK